MIPGKTKCHAGWALEYAGYLMAGYHGHTATDYYCIDKDPENLPDGEGDASLQSSVLCRARLWFV